MEDQKLKIEVYSGFEQISYVVQDPKNMKITELKIDLCEVFKKKGVILKPEKITLIDS